MIKLKKSLKDRVFFGVCGGIGSSIGIDPPVIRLAFIIGAIFTGTLLFWIYLLLAILLQTEEK